jgi:tripartite-type tricarboxylate transporter receptor subunit TctC
MKTLARVLVFAFGLGTAFAQAQNYPDRPIKFIVPVAAGGTTDVIGRVIGARLTEVWGQPIVIENRAGGAGIPATEVAAHSKPDGYTLFLGTIGALTVNPYLFPNAPVDIVKDFIPVTLIAAAPTMLVVSPSLPVKSVKELIAYAKANPGTLNYASPGNGTSPHLAGELFKQLAGIDATHIPYKGAAPALTDVIGGRVQFMFDNIITSLPHVKEGRLRALAVTASTRSRLVPDLPTMAEAGLAGQEISGWVGIVAPTGTPREIVLKIQQEVAKVLRTPEVRERLAAMGGAEPVGGTPEEFDALFKADIARFARVIEQASIPKAD